MRQLQFRKDLSLRRECQRTEGPLRGLAGTRMRQLVPVPGQRMARPLPRLALQRRFE